MKGLYFIGFCLFFISCNQSGCKSTSAVDDKYDPVGVGVDMSQVLAKRNGVLLPNSCNIVNIEKIAEALEVPANAIEITDSSPAGSNPTHSSCFFKWEDVQMPNAGILFQAMRDPMGGEFPNYVQVYIESKKTTGEQGIGEQPMIFKTLEGLGDDGAYSTEAGKYFWRLGDDVIFSIAFNSPHSADQQYRIARKLGALMTQNYIDGK